MKIVLVKCPREAGGFSENSESLALAYLAAELRNAGHETLIRNYALRGNSIEQVVASLTNGSFGLIGFNLPDPSLVAPTLAVVRHLRNAGVCCHICVGGHTATFESQHILEMCSEIDSIALFEGEDTICELADALENRRDWRKVAGLAFRNVGGVAKSSKRIQAKSLDRLAFPARDDLPYVIEKLPDIGAVPVLSSRGCYFDCAFCSVRAFYEVDRTPTWRRRSVSNVLDEVEELVSGHGVRDILFVDDLFISRSKPTMKYAEEFARTVIARRLDFTFTISATVDSVSNETFVLLREAGLRQVYLGAESASSDILKFLNKWFKPPAIERAVGILRDLDLDTSVSFINFTPATRMHHLRENLDFFARLGTNILQGLLNRYQVYAGTPLYDELQQSGRLVGQFPHLDYKGDDPEVDFVYEICRTCFGPLLELAYELKRMERKTQRGTLQIRQSITSAPDNADKRDSLSRIMTGINRDAVTMFERVLRFVANGSSSVSTQALNSFQTTLREEVAKTCSEWLNTLRFVENFSLGSSFDTGGANPAFELTGHI